MIEYQLACAEPGAHEFSLQLSLTTQPGTSVEFTLPAWIPGSYMIRDFARNLLDLVARGEQGQLLELKQLDKQTWQLVAEDRQVNLSYRVYAFDESVRSAYFDNTRAYFNGTSMFLRVVGRESEPHQLHLSAPESDSGQFDHWRVATTLTQVDCDSRGFGLYQASDYAQLIDHPFEIGIHERQEFEVCGKPHSMLLVDAPGADMQRIVQDLAPVLEQHVGLFGELPIDRYAFLTLATANGYGGLEHRDSTSLVCKRSDLPYRGDSKLEKGYRTFLALCSHEYFHLWNVKRIRPQRLLESALQTETHTELLWAFEGITSYYDELALPRAGALDARGYLDMLAPSVTRYLRNHGRHRQSIAASSFDAWTRFYKQDENAPNVIVSYYNKGGLVALGLDHFIRIGSGDESCLDDLMRLMWSEFGRTGRGIDERGDIEGLVGRLIGASPQAFFDAYVYGTEELPLEQWFAEFGVGLRRRGRKSADDQGGVVEPDATVAPAVVSLGARTSASEGHVLIEQTLHGGAARIAGLAAGDLMIAIDGERCTGSNLEELLSRYGQGDRVEVSYFRRNRLTHAAVELAVVQDDTCDLWLIPDPALEDSVIARRNRWLGASGMVG